MKRVAHIIKPMKTTQCPSNLLFFDTETIGVKDKTDHEAVRQYLWFGCVNAFRYEGGKRTRELKDKFFDCESFWKIVEKRLDVSRPLHVFAHNLPFDLTICDFWRLSEEMGMETSYAILEDPPTAIMMNWRGCKLVFIDTLNYWRVALKLLGESLDLPKLEMPRVREWSKEWLTYCQRDVEVLAQSVTGMIDYVRKHKLGKFGLTAASQAMNAYKSRFMKHPIFVHEDQRVLSMERDAYYGGLVHCFFIGEVKRKKLYHLDVTSLYPSVMLNEYPTKMVERTWKITPFELKRRMKSKGAVATVKIEVDDDVYPYRTKDRLLEAKGSFTTTLCGPELDRALGNGVVTSVTCAAFYEMAPIFKDYVNFFWEERKRYKEEGNKVGDFFTKLLMNSLYGKFGQKGFDWVPLSVHNLRELYKENGIPFPKEYNAASVVFTHIWGLQRWVPIGFKSPLRIRNWNGFLQFRVEAGEHHESCPIVAAYVTSYGREKLRHFIRCAGRKQVYYCDTDSLFVSERGHNNLVREGHVGGNRLGLLKLEGTNSTASFYAPKDYVFGDKVVMKGIRPNAIDLGDNEYLQDQFEGLRGVLGREPEPYIRIKWIRKKQSRVYSKGVVGKDGWVEYPTITEDI